MRQVADAARVLRLMHGLSKAADRETAVYFTGGASAVLLGWRATTIDVDLAYPWIRFVSAGTRPTSRA